MLHLIDENGTVPATPSFTRGQEIAMSTSPQVPQDDRLWVPLLTHYRRPQHQRQGSTVEIDPDRTAAHLSFIRPWVRQFLLAGSTGDGWEMSLEQLLVLVRLTSRPDLFQGTRFLVGALRPTTEGVVEWARAIESTLDGMKATAGEYCGLSGLPACRCERQPTGYSPTLRAGPRRDPQRDRRLSASAGHALLHRAGHDAHTRQTIHESRCSRTPAEKTRWPFPASPDPKWCVERKATT